MYSFFCFKKSNLIDFEFYVMMLYNIFSSFQMFNSKPSLKSFYLNTAPNSIGPMDAKFIKVIEKVSARSSLVAVASSLMHWNWQSLVKKSMHVWVIDAPNGISKLIRQSMSPAGNDQEANLNGDSFRGQLPKQLIDKQWMAFGHLVS